MARTTSWAPYATPKWRNEVDTDVSKALTAEFLATLVFLFLATTGTKSALAVGLSYAVSSYAVSAISGGHLNPIVSIALALSGHLHGALAGMYVIAQICGAICASLLQALLIPHLHIAHNKHLVPPGCLPSGLIHGWFTTVLWELVVTVFFLAVVYGVIAGCDKFSPVAPLAAGLAIYVIIEAAGDYTGGLVNPALLVAPSIVFLCNWSAGRFWSYLLGQLLGAILAAGIAVAHIGNGDAYTTADDDLDIGRGGLGERLVGDPA